MRKVAFSTAFVSLLIGSSIVFAAPAPQKVIDVANTKVAALGMDPVIVQAVKVANSEGKTLKEIKKLDQKWVDDQGTGGTPALMTALMANDCARHLGKLVEKNPFITEIFVTDNQGANVCQTDPTSDYWQGDEEKFTKVFNVGVLVTDPKSDDSGRKVSQVSVPVVDGQTHVGTMTVGVDINLVQ